LRGESDTQNHIPVSAAAALVLCQFLHWYAPGKSIAAKRHPQQSEA
jgi:hypothetical protein